MIYRIEIHIEALVLADDEHEACEYADAAMLDTSAREHVSAHEWDAHSSYPDRWNSDCLVYGEHSGDVTVAEALRMTERT